MKHTFEARVASVTTYRSQPPYYVDLVLPYTTLEEELAILDLNIVMSRELLPGTPLTITIETPDV